MAQVLETKATFSKGVVQYPVVSGVRCYATPASLYYASTRSVGYLSHDARYADLLFEVITRRYQQRATVLTTNKPFGEWNQVFPNAAWVVALVERLVQRSEILSIDGDSYRFKEAREAATAKAALRAAPRKKR